MTQPDDLGAIMTRFAERVTERGIPYDEALAEALDTWLAQDQAVAEQLRAVVEKIHQGNAVIAELQPEAGNPSARPTDCDYPGAPSILDGECRCLVCGRCGHHTGNNTQGHYWSFCSVTKTVREHHLCCPDDCELETQVD